MTHSRDSDQDELSKLKVWIGPLSDVPGGVPTHIHGIMAHSRHMVRPFRYSALSPYWPGYRGLGYLPFNREIHIPDPYARALTSIRLQDFDLVHTHGHPYWLSLYHDLDRTRVPRVHTVHQLYLPDDSPSERERRMRASQNLALVGTCRSADATITVSQVLRDLLLDEYGISSELIPNGVDLAQCAVANGTRFLRWSDLSGDFVLWIGSRLKVKRPELLIRIAKEMPEIQFVAIGNGLQKAMAVEVLGELPPNVIAIGPVPHSIILDGMRASKAVLITSRRESFSLAACEGLGCERPAVAPMSVGLDDVVGGVDTRLLYDADEPRTAVQALRFAIEHPESGRRGKNRIAVTHDWRVIAPKIDRLYEEIRGRAGR